MHWPESIKLKIFQSPKKKTAVGLKWVIPHPVEETIDALQTVTDFEKSMQLA